MVRRVPSRLLGFSRNLRKNQTPWEAKLWNRIRAKRFYGLKFKRQLRVGEYIVDFCCQDKKLIIELDGGQHDENSIREQDLLRRGYLESEGYNVLRFWNNELEHNFDGVLEKIKEEVMDT